MDRDVRAIGNDDVVAGVRDVLVMNEVAPIGEEVTGGPVVNAEVRDNLLFIVTATTTTGRA
jgi:hypothetical protein